MNERKSGKRGIAAWLLVLAVLGAGGFLAYQYYGKGNTKIFNFPTFKKDDGFLSKTNDWLKTDVYSKFSGGVGEVWNDKKDEVQEELQNQKNDLEKKSTSAAKKFIANKVLDYLGVEPQELWQPQCP